MKILFASLMCALANIACADEPWMYPVAKPPTPTLAEFQSAITTESFAADADGYRPFECTTRVVDANVASFKEIVKWYADKTGETQLSQTLDRFIHKGISGPGIGMFKTAPMAFSTHLTYRFKPEQKHITILHAEEAGDVVAISLLGLDRETSIQVLRHNPNLQAPARNGGEPSDVRESHFKNSRNR